MLLDPLANALNTIESNEAVGNDVTHVSPVNHLIRETLKILIDEGYIEDAMYIDNNKGGIYRVKLNGNIHEIKAIKPHFPLKNDEIEKWEMRYLPSHAVGYLILTTPEGVMTHTMAKKKGVGGKLIAYVY